MNMAQKLTKLADLHATTCFLNSLLREWNDFVIYRSDKTLLVLIQLADNEHIQIPLRKYSILGRHEYTGKFYLLINNKCTEINFSKFLERICIKLESIHNIQLDQFKTTVLSSRNTIHQALKVHATIHNENHTFKNTEHALVIGHNFHPISKSRDKFTSTDLQNYAPEFKGEFSLQWLLVDIKILHHVQAKNLADKNWLNTLFAEDCPQHVAEIPTHMQPVPMHPWQWQYLRQNPEISDLPSKQSNHSC